MEPVQNVPAAPMEAPKPKTSWGLLSGLAIIVIAIVLGAAYFLNERIASAPLSPEAAALSTQGTSTDPAEIERDLNAQSPEEFEEELDRAFLEMDAAFEAQ